MYGTSILLTLAMATAAPACGFFIRFEIGFERSNNSESSPCARTPSEYPGYPAWVNPGYNSPYVPNRTPTQPAAPPPAEWLPLPKREEAALTAARRNPARLIVQVPPDAKLYIDGQLKETAAGQRIFATPPLQRGEPYYYTLRSVVVRPERTYIESKRLIVRAGEIVQVVFPEPTTSDIVRVSVVGPSRP